MRELIIYSTLGCHLCDRAKDIIWPQLQSHDLKLTEVDIACSISLVEKYGVRIPVVKLAGASEDLAWPFDAEGLTYYLIENTANQG